MALRAVQPMRKAETPAQWNRALQRALNEALDVLTEAGTGATFVESSTQPGTLYRVTLDGCSCAAGARGVVCKHRACLAAQMGVLPLDEGPEPAPVRSESTRVDCAACSGCGSVYSRSGGWRCDYCQVAGRVAVIAQPVPIAA